MTNLDQSKRPTLIERLERFAKFQISEHSHYANAALAREAIAALTPMTPLVLDREAVARDAATGLALEIHSIFEDASNHPCTCNIDENSCAYCNAWDLARRRAEAEILQTIIALTSQAGGLDGWQDIATAPKDGTLVMVWGFDEDEPDDADDDNREPAALPYPARYGPQKGLWWHASGLRRIIAPTHWRPLPASPAICASNPSVGGGV